MSPTFHFFDVVVVIRSGWIGIFAFLLILEATSSILTKVYEIRSQTHLCEFVRSAPPQDGASLNYIVQNLPDNIVS